MHLLSLPIKPILLFSLLSISVIPTLIVSLELYSFAKKDAHQVLDEKHLSLAKNLTAPVFAYLENHRTIVRSVARRMPDESNSSQNINAYLSSAKTDFKNFLELAYFNTTNSQTILTSQEPASTTVINNLKTHPCTQTIINKQTSYFSSVVKNPFSAGNTVLFCEPVIQQQKLQGIVVAALSLDIIEQYRAGIAFGDSGHAAIVDQKGIVVAHPNKEWTKENKNIADWPIVKSMVNREEGLTQFYSSFTKEDMVAAYTTVPDYGWGIMVPQRKSEIDEKIISALIPQIKWGAISIVFAIILSILLSKWIASPLTQLVKGTFMLSENRLNAGALKLGTNSPKELLILSNALELMTKQFIQIKSKLETVNSSLQDRVDEATEQLRDQNIRLKKMAVNDELTDLPNRRGLRQKLEQTLAHNKNINGVFSILMCDIDRFKLVNDNYGHMVGDNVLQAFAKVTPSEISENDYIGRWGGEEFLCVLENTDSESAKKVAEKIRSAVRKISILPDDPELEITVSIGVATYPYDSETVDELINFADNALYEAKHIGRDKVVCSSNITDSVSYIANQIRFALNENRLATALQPVYDINSQEKIGQQSLARIQTSNDEILEAHHFIHQAEQLNLIEKIDDFVLNQTLRFIDNNYSEANAKLAFIHLSTAYLCNLTSENKLFNQIKKIKAKHQYENDFPLVLELSEAQFTGNKKKLKNVIKLLIDNDVKIALRKFETSATGLELLTSLPFDYVKLDGSSIRLAMSNNRYQVALKHLITMCKDLDLSVIVEQIETTCELDYCKTLNIDLAQGYYLARPQNISNQDLAYEA